MKYRLNEVFNTTFIIIEILFGSQVRGGINLQS